MKRLFLYLLLLCGVVSVGYGQPAAGQLIDFRAEVMRPIRMGDSSALSLVGQVVFYHNGAVILCDSATLSNDRTIGHCYNNVIIHKGETYIYGDRAQYDGNVNLARVFAPLVKTVDQDAVLYTYNFTFNTKTNVGFYTGGGTMYQKDNRMESKDGYYHADTHELVGVRDVEMRSPEYRLRSDSVTYNTDTEVAQFYTRSYIWNKNDEFLTALQGTYDRKADAYTFTNDSYMLTKTQEVWADTIIYHATPQDALLLRNVQVVDDEQQAAAFGDMIQYWGKEQKALLTRDPVVAGFEENQDHKRDTLYMRADSIFVYTYHRDSLLRDSMLLDSLTDGNGELPQPVELATPQPNGQQPSVLGNPEQQSQPEQKEQESVGKEAPKDSVELSEKAKKRQLIQERRRAKEEERRAKIKEREERWKEREMHRKGMAEKLRLDSLSRADSIAKVKRLEEQKDSLSRVEKLRADSLQKSPADTVVRPINQDSLVRKMFAYHHVRIFRNDFQAVCDSLTGFSMDSTLHMYIHPVLWNDNNQVTSEVVDIFTLNQKIDRALFTGDPILSQEVDTLHFNQIKGKVIESFFRDGSIYRTDVNGNGQTYYFMQDGDSTDRYISGFMKVECADITFYFEEQQVNEIVWRGKPVYSIYPMDKLPADQELILPGFQWEGKRRPTKADVFTRTFRPSMRSEYARLAKPSFPITEKIDRAREELVKAHLWLDRNDTLTPEALEFIGSLGSSRLAQ